MSKNIDVMVDLETISLQPDAGILSIGAVVFNTELVSKDRYFYSRIDVHSISTSQFSKDASTMRWWDKQDPAIRAEAFVGITPIKIALCDFYAWCMELNRPINLWGNGADFDNVILKTAYESLGLTVPWNYWNNRCFRTLKNLFPGITIGKQVAKHNALEDARYQACWAEEILKQAKITGAYS